jgi:hypothetical protein
LQGWSSIGAGFCPNFIFLPPITYYCPLTCAIVLTITSLFEMGDDVSGLGWLWSNKIIKRA